MQQLPGVVRTTERVYSTSSSKAPKRIELKASWVPLSWKEYISDIWYYAKHFGKKKSFLEKKS